MQKHLVSWCSCVCRNTNTKGVFIWTRLFPKDDNPEPFNALWKCMISQSFLTYQNCRSPVLHFHGIKNDFWQVAMNDLGFISDLFSSSDLG